MIYEFFSFNMSQLAVLELAEEYFERTRATHQSVGSSLQELLESCLKTIMLVAQSGEVDSVFGDDVVQNIVYKACRRFGIPINSITPSPGAAAGFADVCEALHSKYSPELCELYNQHWCHLFVLEHDELIDRITGTGAATSASVAFMEI
jgi:hypothetical protein